MLNPPLKWAGGKRWLVDAVRTIWQESGKKRLVEPFCGGLSISLGLIPENALINDINPHLINFYSFIKKGLKFSPPPTESEEFYYQQRDRFNFLISENKYETEEAAQLFYYLNRNCYNGLCRFNKNGLFNVPKGKIDSIHYITDFAEYQYIFKNWNFQSTSYKNLFLKKDDLVFVDPPYDGDFTNYSKDGFSWYDQIELVKWLSNFDVSIILCNKATPRVVNLYRSNGFSLKFLEEKIRISADGSRKAAKVVLATKRILHDSDLFFALNHSELIVDSY